MFEDLKHQADTFERFKDKQYGALFFEPGLGKTRTAIRITEHKRQHEGCTAALVITTKTLMKNWELEELPKHSTMPYIVKVWPERLVTRQFGYQLINADAVKFDGFPPFFQDFLVINPNFILIVDESTFAKTLDTQRTQVILRISRRAKWRYIMSGSPITQSPLDIYAQSEILKPGILGYSGYRAFQLDITVKKSMFLGTRVYKQVVGYKNLDELNDNIKRFAAIYKAKDCLDLPKRKSRKVPVEFSPEQRKHYNELREIAVTMVQGNLITATNAVSLINKFLQICAGQLKHEGKYLVIENERIHLLKELCEEAGKTIIWCPFVGVAEMIAKHLGKTAIRAHSGMTPKQRWEAIDDWKKDKYKDLIANQASFGHGLTLTESHNVIYYANFWSAEHRIQSEFRTDRIGQKQSVQYTDLYTPGTAEEKVAEILMQARETAEAVMGNRIKTNPSALIMDLLK